MTKRVENINTSRINGQTAVFQIILLVIIVLLSRVLFLSRGYGSEVDAWRVATNARDIALTGQYIYSRAPGHPVPELIYTLIWNSGSFWQNGVTAVMSALAVVFFILILRKLGFKNIFLPALAFALTPVIYINSVNTMDHIWALAFILGSIYFVLVDKPMTAGILLGAANGCRLTSALIGIPLLMLLYYNNRESKKSIRELLEFTFAGGIVTLILFTPVILKYGLYSFDIVVGKGYPKLSYLAFRMFISTFGFIGFIAILTALIVQFIQKTASRKIEHKRSAKWDSYFDISLLTGIILFVIVFLLLPHKAAYLVPVIPLFLILLGRFLNSTLFNVVCVSLIVSPFLLSMNRIDLTLLPDFSRYSTIFNIAGSKIVCDLNGPILSEHSKRLKQLEYVNKIIAKCGLLTRKSVVVTGEAYPLIDVTLPYNIQGNVVYEYLLDSLQLKHYTGEGYDIYYLSGEDKTNLEENHIDLNDYGGKNLLTR